MGIIYGLFFILLLLIALSVFEGISIKRIFTSGWNSGKKSFVVLKIFVLIGAITSSWMISGTIPSIVYAGLKFLDPSFYYISTFIIACGVSFLLGSSFGTVGTVGIVLITIGRGLGVDLNIAAGSILAGAFFGDRCSPVSSSASLIATLTNTNLYNNIKNMTLTGFIGFILSCVFYFFMPKIATATTSDNILITELLKYFKINFFSILPALSILICGFFRVNVKKSMTISVILASLSAFFLQKQEFLEILKTIFVGYSFPNEGPLLNILKGGGLISMVKASVIVFISCIISGILENITLFNKIKRSLEKIKNKNFVFLSTILVSFVSAGIGCNQSIAVVLSETLMKDVYKKNDFSQEDFALHLENTAIVISPLIPWNIASLIPITILGVSGVSYLKYSFFLYSLPIITFIYLYLKSKKIINFK